MIIDTERIILLPASASSIKAEMISNHDLAKAISAEVTNNWPPEELKDAIPFFLSSIEKNSDNAPWLYRYCLLKQNENDKPVLVGSIGFLGQPDKDGKVETGYSVLPQFEGRGYATEMLKGILDWAIKNGAKKIIARTDTNNLKSQRVLEKAGFHFVGEIPGEDKLLFEL